MAEVIRDLIARREFERNWREWTMGGLVLKKPNRHGPGEYQFYTHVRLGPLMVYVNLCDCGERSVSAFLTFPSPANHVRRIAFDWYSEERPNVRYQNFRRPTVVA